MLEMQKFKYVFIILGIIYIIEAIYSFMDPKDFYTIISFRVPYYVFAIYKLLVGISFILVSKIKATGKN
jgi:uncharacterized membrane protein